MVVDMLYYILTYIDPTILTYVLIRPKSHRRNPLQPLSCFIADVYSMYTCTRFSRVLCCIPVRDIADVYDIYLAWQQFLGSQRKNKVERQYGTTFASTPPSYKYAAVNIDMPKQKRVEKKELLATARLSDLPQEIEADQQPQLEIIGYR